MKGKIQTRPIIICQIDYFSSLSIICNHLTLILRLLAQTIENAIKWIWLFELLLKPIQVSRTRTTVMDVWRYFKGWLCGYPSIPLCNFTYGNLNSFINKWFCGYWVTQQFIVDSLQEGESQNVTLPTGESIVISITTLLFSFNFIHLKAYYITLQFFHQHFDYFYSN